MSDIVTVASIDPGLLTGVCVVDFNTGEGCVKEQSAELKYEELLPWALTHLSKADVVVVERFTINQRTIKNTQAPWSLMGIGVITSVQMLSDKDIVLQNPSDAMGLVDNPMLTRLGLWHKGGQGHANDALRHAVLYAVKTLRWRDPRLIEEQK